jgi:antitoxin ParD1/3/4
VSTLTTLSRQVFQQEDTKNVSEVIRAGLRLLEEEENRLLALKNAIKEGLESGIIEDFDPFKHLESLKAKRLD